jgi:gas vesicle protein
MTIDRIYYTHDAEVAAMRRMTLVTMLSLTLGMGIGAILALLFAPASGRSTRHDLATSIEEGLHTGREKLEPVVKRLEEEFVDLRKSVDERLKRA